MNVVNIALVKQIPIIAFLENLGYAPTSQDVRFAIYEINGLQPIKVSRKMNRWRDGRTHSWHNIIDLARCIFHDDDQIALVDAVIAKAPLHFHGVSDGRRSVCGRYRNVVVKDLEDTALLSYLRTRAIAAPVAKRYCKEMRFTFGRRTHIGLAFPNASGGYELVSKQIKDSISPHDVTLIRSTKIRSNICMVFYDYLDFLSYWSLVPANFRQFSESMDYMVLNSMSNLDRASVILYRYDIINCCLPNDSRGRRMLEILADTHDSVYDSSDVYDGYRNLNHFLRNRRNKPTKK